MGKHIWKKLGDVSVSVIKNRNAVDADATMELHRHFARDTACVLTSNGSPDVTQPATFEDSRSNFHMHAINSVRDLGRGKTVPRKFPSPVGK